MSDVWVLRGDTEDDWCGDVLAAYSDESQARIAVKKLNHYVKIFSPMPPPFSNVYARYYTTKVRLHDD